MSTVVPTVGDREIHMVENNDLYIKIDDASIDLMEEEYVNKVPFRGLHLQPGPANFY